MKKSLVGIVAVVGVVAVGAFAFFFRTEELNSATIAIAGMTCSSCAGHIAETLQQLEGVTLAEVSYEKKHAAVKFDPTLITLAAMENEISKLGFSTANFAAKTLPAGQKKCEAENPEGMGCCAPPTKGSDT